MPRPADGTCPATALRRAPVSGRSASTCTCRSARCGAATATSTPTPRPSSGGGGVAGGVRRARGRRGRDGSRARWVRTGPRSRPSSSAAARRRCSPRGDLARILAAIDTELGLAPGAEVTTEANPDSVTPESLAALREGGFNRISFGMQSAVPHVLQVLERTHDPARVPQVVALGARGRLRAGEPRPDLRDAGGVASPTGEASLDAALACEPDHVSAYSLIVEDGTRLARQVRTRRDADARRRRPRRQVRPGRRALRGGGPGVVRGVELGARRGLALPAQRALLDQRELVGRRPGRALARRGGAVVERQAPQRVRRPHRRRRVPGPGRRGARRADPRDGAGAPRGPAPRRPAPVAGLRRRSSTTWSPAASPYARATGSC